MSENIENDIAPNTAPRRREFLKAGCKAAIAAPAVALLLSASSKPAKADAIYLPPQCNPALDGYSSCGL
jgi:hypothetical protein